MGRLTTGVTCPEHGTQKVTHLGPQTVTLTCGGTGSNGVYVHLGEHEKAAKVAQENLVKALNPLTHGLTTLEAVDDKVRYALAALDSAWGQLV